MPEAEANFTYTSHASDKLDIKFIPFHMLVTGNVTSYLIEGRHILVGPSFNSNSEYFYTKANGKNVSHLQIIIEQVESILQGKTFKVYQGNLNLYLNGDFIGYYIRCNAEV